MIGILKEIILDFQEADLPTRSPSSMGDARLAQNLLTQAAVLLASTSAAEIRR